MVLSIKPIAAGKHELEQRFRREFNYIAVDFYRSLARGKPIILFRSANVDEGYYRPVQWHGHSPEYARGRGSAELVKISTGALSLGCHSATVQSRCFDQMLGPANEKGVFEGRFFFIRQKSQRPNF